MSKRTRLTSRKFHAINRDLKMHGKVKDVAAVHSVSEETVRTVKRSKTWPRFEAMKKLRVQQRRQREAAGPIKVVVQQPLVPQPVLRELDKITQAPANQIRLPLPTDIKTVTEGEWEDLNRKVGKVYQLVGQRQSFFSRLLRRN
jgi:hypothetical protein